MLNASFLNIPVQRIIKTARSQRFDNAHRKQALKAVALIETFNSQKLSPHQKRLADDYAIQVFGKPKYAPWLYVYTLMSGTFKEGWIPDNFFGKVVVPKVNKELRWVAKFKTFANVIFKTKALPDIAYYVDGLFYNTALSVIDIAVLRDIIGETYTDVFVKKDWSGRGRGVIKLSIKDIRENIFREIGNCVIQWPIRQHVFFEKIMPSSTATIRITTVKDLDGKIDFRASYLRVGRTDTPWVQSANCVRVAIIDRHGELDSVCYTEYWRRWLSHPDTKFIFSKQRIPRFNEAVEFCIKLHASVPHFTIVGWDIIISNKGEIQLIEWNGGHCGIKFSEATVGPSFTGLEWESLRE
jgi:hypothetical protein